VPNLIAPPKLLDSTLAPANGKIAARVTGQFSVGADLVLPVGAMGIIRNGEILNATGTAPFVLPVTPAGVAVELSLSLDEWHDGKVRKSTSGRTVSVPAGSTVTWAQLVDVVPVIPSGEYVTPPWAYDVFTAKDTAVAAAATSTTKAGEAAASLASMGKGAANGVAPLDGGARVPDVNLPTRLSDVSLSATIAAAMVSESLGTILVLGDSIAAGVGATVIDKAFPAQLAVVLRAAGLDSTVVGAGVSGNTTDQMLARLPALLTTYTPKVVIIQASINDARLDRTITAEDTASYIRQMVNLARAKGATAYVVGAAPMDPIWFGNATANSIVSARKAVATNARVKQLCAEIAVEYVDMFAPLLGRVGVLADGLHPNDTGHLVWARTIAAAITEAKYRSSKKTLFADGFDRPNSTTTLATPWSTADTWGSIDGSAYMPTPVATGTAYVDVGTPDHAIVASQPSTLTADVPLSVIARRLSVINYYFAETSPTTGKVNLKKIVAGAITTLGTFDATFDGTADEILLTVEGAHLMVFLNGSPAIAATDAVIATGNGAGIRQANTEASRWGYVAITA
jgi:lysophospholipase L1-like esterase